MCNSVVPDYSTQLQYYLNYATKYTIHTKKEFDLFYITS